VRLWLWWLWRPPCLARRVIVNFTHSPDEAVQGVFWSWRWGWITLRDVSALTSGQPPQHVDGEVVIHVDKIAYFQVIG